MMSIGRSFEEAIQKALRMVNEDVDGFDPTMKVACDEVRGVRCVGWCGVVGVMRCVVWCGGCDEVCGVVWCGVVVCDEVGGVVWWVW